MSQANSFSQSMRHHTHSTRVAVRPSQLTNVSAAVPARSLQLPASPPLLPSSGNRLWDALFKNLDYNFDAVYTVIDAILTAKDRCQVTPLYIQGVVTASASFLTSNVGQASQLALTEVDSCWRLGRAADCALQIAHAAVDSCHAAIHYHDDTGFRLADLGSATGLRHNRHRLPKLAKRQLRDGDLIELGTLRIEFFIDDFRSMPSLESHPSTYF